MDYRGRDQTGEVLVLPITTDNIVEFYGVIHLETTLSIGEPKAKEIGGIFSSLKRLEVFLPSATK